MLLGTHPAQFKHGLRPNSMQVEEDDYMSDAFLKELEDVRPGLLNREGKRKAKVR